MTNHAADIASERTPGPREAWQDALPMLDKALNEVWDAAHPDAAQYIAERMYEDGWNVSRVEAANTYDELLTRAAVLLAAARYPGDMTTEQWGVAVAEARRHIEETNEVPPEEAALDAALDHAIEAEVQP